jgi:glycosyltransferase involved in cell wall biosynthesis
VHPIAEFPRIALEEGITDAYGVFEIFLEGLVGMHPTDPKDPHFMEGPDMGALLRRAGIRLHGSIYPGGGLRVTPEGLDRVRRLTRRLTTAFSYVPEVLDAVPGVVEVSQAFTDTSFYAYGESRWSARDKLVCLFAADAPPRKGVDVALSAFRDLPADRFHLHVVGPHLERRGELPEDLATFHGWLSPERLRDLHRKVHVFLSPVSAEPAGPTTDGVTDGFPTQAAADAMSSGCLLVSANPAHDGRVLHAGVHYLECDPDPDLVRRLLGDLAAEPDRLRPIADAGAARVRERMDVRMGIAEKLRLIGFQPRCDWPARLGPAHGALPDPLG